MSGFVKKLTRWFNKPKVVSGNVYYVKFIFNQEVFYKIGFTTKHSINERFSYAGSSDFKYVNKVILFTYQDSAWNIEQDLLDHFRKQLAFGKYSNDPSQPLAGNGQSELFKTDVLGLDEDLYSVPDHLKKEYKVAQTQEAEGCLFTLILMVCTGGVWAVILGFMWVMDIINTPKTLPTISKKPRHPQRIQDILDTLVAYNKLS